jgi:hypothetical protein
MKISGARMTQGTTENVFICDGMRKVVAHRTSALKAVRLYIKISSLTIVWLLSCDLLSLILFAFISLIRSRDSSVSIETRLTDGRLGFDYRQVQRWNFFRHRVQTGSRIHSASYPMATGVSYPSDKAAGA